MITAPAVMSAGNKEPLSGMLKKEELIKAYILILQDIQEEECIGNKAILQEALDAGLKAQEREEYLRLVVNAVIDWMYGKVAGRLQLKSMIENGKLAGEVIVEE